MNLPLAGRRALVTGAGRGVGLATARLFAEQGAEVVLHANTATDRAREVAAALGARALGVVAADLSQPGAGAALFAQADVLAGGRLDVLVNNAGIYRASALAASDRDWHAAWADTLQVNLQAVADLCRAAVLAFAGRGGGCLVNIGSRAGHRGDDADHAAYAASKGGVLALTRTIARAYGKDGVLAYALAPGWIDTEMARQEAAAMAAAAREIPIGRVATAEEIAAVCAFLASGACASATGTCIDINGASYVR
ncbi:MAG TPA: SDR family oxidoreductase [Xanthomonadaceae bacterium]|nr:SDR family oxidoreductase [Xanthomonadaceae bacterium]